MCLPEAAREAAAEIELVPNLAVMFFVVLPIVELAVVVPTVAEAVLAAPTAVEIESAVPVERAAESVPTAVGISVAVVQHIRYELCYHCGYDARCTKPVESALQ